MKQEIFSFQFEIGDTIQKLNPDGEIIGFPFTATQSEVYRQDWYTLIKKKEPSNVSVSVEDMTKKEQSKIYGEQFHKRQEYGEPLVGFMTRPEPLPSDSFEVGWDASKEKSEELIRELSVTLSDTYSALETENDEFVGTKERMLKIQSVITKAEQFLKGQS